MIKGFVRRFAAISAWAGALAPLAFAQQSGGGFDPSSIASGVTTQIGGVAAAGVGVLALTIGLSAAWRYAKKFLKG